ncbi:hypothetical protein C8R46DRAFT_1196540 [Mycena filopes]|nr:hypothetical protein C8R46DRAFT_1196540 [Mycena filopes]
MPKSSTPKSRTKPEKWRRAYVACASCRKRKVKCVTRMEDGGASSCTRCGLKGLKCEFSTVSESVPSERGTPSPLSSRSSTPAPARTVGQFEQQPAAPLRPGALHLDSEVTAGRPVFQIKHIAHPHRHMLPGSALELGLQVPHLHFDNFIPVSARQARVSVEPSLTAKCERVWNDGEVSNAVRHTVGMITPGDRKSEWTGERSDGETEWTQQSSAVVPELGCLLEDNGQFDNGQFDTDDPLAQLTGERQLLVDLRSQNSAIISPLRRIPPEVLAEIFIWTLPAVWTLSERRSFSFDGSPWLLTHVSRSWRATAISTSSLWSVVAISFTSDLGPPAGLYPLPMLEAQVGRAHNLKIHFYGEQGCDPRPQIEVFKLLVSHSSRWEELSIALTSALVPLLDRLQDRIPLLRRLHLQWSYPESDAGVHSIDCFNRAPSLVDVTVVNEQRLVPLRLAFPQLIRYQLNGPWKLHRDILQLGLNLVEVRIILAFDATKAWSNPTQGAIHLPYLRRLFVSHAGLLHSLVAPALDEIALYTSYGERIQNNFRPFIERSGCTVRRLCLYGLVEAASLADILKGLTTITELAILTRNGLNGGVDHDVAFLTVLTLTPETPPLAPQLRSIYLGSVEGSSLNPSACMQMISSRWKQRHRALRAAALLSAEPLGPVDDLNMQQEGLDLLVLDGRRAEEIMDDWTYQTNWN